MLKYKSGFFLLIISLFLLAGSYFLFLFLSVDPQKIARDAEHIFEEKINGSNARLKALLNSENAWTDQNFLDYFEEDAEGLYLLESDSLIYWNNSRVPVSSELKTLNQKSGFCKLKFGYYLYSSLKSGHRKAVSLRLIKPLFDLQNNYLQNEFRAWTMIPPEANLSDKNNEGTAVFLNENYIFSIDTAEKKYYSKVLSSLSAALFFLGLCSALLFVLLWLKRKFSVAVLFSSAVVLLLFKYIIAGRPAFLSGSILYDVSIFANGESLMNFYLADVLFNSVALFFAAVVLCLCMPQNESKTKWIILIFVLFTVALLCACQYNQSVKSLVTDSSLSFDFLSVINIRSAAVIGIFSIVLSTIALFVVLYKLCRIFTLYNKGFLWYLVGNACVFFGLHFLNPLDTLAQSLWILLFSTLLFTLVQSNFQRFSLGIGIQILLMSLITAGFLNYYIDKNEKLYLDEFAYKLSERQDILLENEFSSIPARIQNDEKLKILLSFLPSSEKEIEQLLQQNYFTGYFNRYNIDIALFDKECNSLLSSTGPVFKNEGFFKDQIDYYSDSTITAGLFFVSRHTKNSRYIGRVKIQEQTLFILLEPKQFEELGSFPDLLLSQQKPEKLKNLSHAVYRSGQTTNRVGEVNYPFYYVDSITLSRSNPDHVHSYFSPDPFTKIILSKKNRDWNYFLTYNSYLFLFFSIICFFCFYVYAYFFTDNFANPSLTRRIQTIVIVVLLLALSAVGITSGKLVSEQFADDNIRQLQDKTQTILNSLSAQFTEEELFDPVQKDLVNLKIKELTNLFNTDISLFSKEGKLFNTSQPRLYEKGLASRLANPKAFNALRNNEVSSITVTEKAGTLKYWSLYTPVFNANKRLSGFVNLPYFAKQNELVNELSGMISALINLYVILFVISIVAGLILARYITKPLRLIKQQIANISLGKRNETISWQSNDEIGKLVSEYNQMLLKLEESANLLAQNERESAWREMAKQVAHEIKNPLTPMKLNLQYLQHLMKNGTKDFNEKFERVSAGIIEQIDTLAGIAGEFSNFAKLPAASLSAINLNDVINASVNLFASGEGRVIQNKISLKEMIVVGDKEQALRVFNNVLKNALQATAETDSPEISLLAEEIPEAYIIKIEDNGCGIDAQTREKIFEPNFTTKNTGSGLGLAMVKSILNNFGGQVSFESTPGAGTVFILKFKKYKKDPE